MKKETIKNDEISLRELLNKVNDIYIYLLSKWKIILVSGLIGAIVGVTYSVIKKPIYKATLTFAVEEEKNAGGGLGSALGLASSLGLDLGGSGGSIFAGTNLTELFKSRAMVEKTLLSTVNNANNKPETLVEQYIENEGWNDKWEKSAKMKDVQFLPGVKRSDYTRVQDSILGLIYDGLIINNLSVAQKDKKVAITTIDIKSTDEIFAKQFCEALAKTVSDFFIATKSKKAQLNMNILVRQTDSVRGELNSAITGVAIANDNTFNLNPALNVRRTPSARRQVDVQANTAILTELVKQSELAKVTLRKETPLIQIIDRPILPLQKERVGKVKGIVIGGLIAVLITIVFFLAQRVFKELNQN